MRTHSHTAAALGIPLAIFVVCGGCSQAVEGSPTTSGTTGAATTGSVTRGPCNTNDVDVVFNGGPVLGNAAVQAVFWGDAEADDAGTRAALGNFLQTVVSSDYITWLSEYDTPSTTIGAGTFLPSVLDSSATPAAGGIADSAIYNELERLLITGEVTAGPNSVFIFFMPADSTITSPQNITSTGHFDGYHNSVVYKGSELYYCVIPYPTSDTLQSHGVNLLEFLTLVASHELSETITDPSAVNGAWFDPTNGEIGDICAWDYPPVPITGGFVVQREWSQAQQACVVHGPPLDLSTCGSACIDRENDPKNCGLCSHVCTAGDSCVAGICTAPADTCGKDLTSDPANCGSCGTACASDQVCVSGQCGTCTPTGAIDCGNACTVVESDPLNCGTCGNACGAMVCVSGTCQACGTGLSACEGKCVDVGTDPDNCGVCGETCGAGTSCVQGNCQ